MFWLALAAVTLLFVVVAGGELLWAHRRLVNLRDVPCLTDGDPRPPRVSIIAPARNEAPHIREALQSVLRLEYPDFELIAIDDRSTDDTGRILDELAATEPRLRVAHIEELPRGWLGKNHAMHVGASQASGELLLFTDADIMMEPTTLARAVAYLTRRGIDNVTVTPGIEHRHLLNQIALGGFHFVGGLFAQPWRCANPKSRRFVGIGAFNLVRRAAYLAAGSHERIPLRPDDDMRLGQLLKQSGASQHLLVGRDMISVEWYPSLWAMFRGLEKNCFAGADYSLFKVMIAMLVFPLFLVLPYAALAWTNGAAFWANLATVSLLSIMHMDVIHRFYRLPRWQCVFLPLGVVLLCLIVARSTALALWRRGVDWRGTFYSLDELRANVVQP